jgi:molecular chaperone DnaK (HSP70)
MEIVPSPENTSAPETPSASAPIPGAEVIKVPLTGSALTSEPGAGTTAEPIAAHETVTTTKPAPRAAARPGPPLKIHDECLLESVGFQFDDDFFFVMLHAGATLTTFGGRVFSTSSDWQTEIALPVFAGTNARASRNRPLGLCTISGVPAGPKGKARVEIRFTAAEDGTLAITAHAKDSGRELFVELSAPEEG